MSYVADSINRILIILFVWTLKSLTFFKMANEGDNMQCFL